MSKLGTLLVREGLLSESDRRMIHRESGTHRGSFARSILALGVLDEHELAALFAAKTSYRIAPKNLVAEIQEDAMGLIPAHILTWLDVIPVRKANGVLYVAMTDPTDQQVLSQLEFFSGMIIKPIIASFSLIRAALKEHLSSHLDFGKSEFEDFLKNHSVSATQFAISGLTKGASAKAPAPVAQTSVQSRDDDFENDLELMSTPQDSSDFVQDTPQTASATDEAMSDDSDSPEDSLVESMDLPTETSESPDLSTAGSDVSGDDFIEESGVGSASGETLAASPDLGLDLGELEGDLDFDLDDEGNETSKAKTTANTAKDVVPTQVSANMDEMLGGDNLDLASDDLGGEPSTTADLETGDELGSLSLDSSEDLSLEETSEQEPTLSTEGDTVQREPSPEDLLIPDDIMGGLEDDLQASAPNPVAVAPEEDINLDLSDGDLAGDDLELAGDLAPADDLTADSDVLSELSTDADLAAFASEDDTATGDSLNEAEMGSLDLSDVTLDADQLPPEPAADALSLDSGDLNVEDDFDVAGLAQAPSLDPIFDESSHLQDISGMAHAGIAALNRALVNLALLSDSKKALGRMADAAGQAGIESGAILALEQDAVKPGVMWNRISGQNAVIPDVPAGLNLETAKAAAKANAGNEVWTELTAALGEAHAQVFTSGWPNADQVPTHVLVRVLANGKTVLGFARFAGAADHDGLKQSFAELLKAAGAKI